MRITAMNVTNTSRDSTFDFVAAGGTVSEDGVPETVSIAPGETAALDVHEASAARLQALIDFGPLKAADEKASRE
jgi:hypothetical protein